jgi:hypothetical protein
MSERSELVRSVFPIGTRVRMTEIAIEHKMNWRRKGIPIGTVVAYQTGGEAIRVQIDGSKTSGGYPAHYWEPCAAQEQS